MWWLDPNGEMIPVSDHKDYAKRHILGKGNGFFKVYERMELWQKALDAYRKYLDELPSAQDAREDKRIHKAIARLEMQLPSGGKSSGSQSTRQ